MRRRTLLERAAQALLLAALPSVLAVGDQELLDASSPARFGLSPPSPRTIVGTHTRLSDEVESWKIDRTLQMVRAMGAGWICELFPWAYIEPRQGQFDWDHPDQVIRDANRQGLEVIARLDYVPLWARLPDTTPRTLLPAQYVDYANFVARFAERYRRAVKYFVIWNEPNTSFEWGYQPVDAAGYVQLLAQAGAAIREVHPEAKILSAGLAPTLDRSDLALDDLIFLQQMYDAGAGAHLDGIAAHSYGWKFPPADPPRPDRLNFARVELLRQVMERNGDAGKPILVTETGWNDSPRWSKSVHPGQRILYTLQAFAKAAAEWPWVQALCMWAFRLPVPSHDYNDYFTFVDVNFRPKKIYDEVQAHAGEWARS